MVGSVCNGITSAHSCKPDGIVLENLIIYPIIKSQCHLVLYLSSISNNGWQRRRVWMAEGKSL